MAQDEIKVGIDVEQVEAAFAEVAPRKTKLSEVDWVGKLTSRKFIVALTAYITSLAAAFNISDTTTGQVVLVVTGVLTLIGYIFAEAKVDAQREGADVTLNNTTVVEAEHEEENKLTGWEEK